jgi:ribonuclease HI
MSQARWSFPPEDWHKANFDGVAKGNPRLTGCRGIIRNSSRGGILVVSFPLGHQTNHLVEASVARHIVKLALASGIKCLWLEGESLNIINCIKGHAPPSWMISNIIEDLRSNLGKFKRTFINHTYREANSVVDWFTNDVVTRNSVMTWKNGDEILAAVIELLRQDQI